MKRHIISIITSSIALLAFSSEALEVTCNAGGLKTAVGEDTSITTLSVTGSIDASDLDFINSSLTSLTSLDLSGVTIEAYKGEKLSSGRSVCDAGIIPDYAFFGSPISSITLPSGITAIDEAAFGQSAITAIVIPESVTKIGDYAFSSCNALTSVEIPSKVTTIGKGVWMNCKALVSANLSANLTALPQKSFSGCGALSSVTLPSAIKFIGDEAFLSCENLNSLSFSSTLEGIGNRAFYNSALKSIDFTPCKALASIGDFAFANCKKLTSAKLPQQSVNLGQGIFFDNTALTSVSMPKEIAAIPSFTFKGTKSLNIDSLPSSVTTIGDYALMGWSSIDKFKLPVSLTSLGDGAMENWESLTELHASEMTTVTALGTEVWAGLTEPATVILYVNDDTFDEFKTTEQWMEFDVRIKTSSIIEVIPDNEVSSGITFNFRDSSLVISSQGEPITSVAIYDLSGRLQLSLQSSAPTVEIGLDRLPDTMFIVNARLADSSTASIKINK